MAQKNTVVFTGMDQPSVRYITWLTACVDEKGYLPIATKPNIDEKAKVLHFVII